MPISLDEFKPESLRPMTACEVSRYAKVSTRILEDWRRRTRESGELVGPPYSQDHEGGKTLYPEVCVKRFAAARAVGHSVREATRFAVRPLQDQSNGLDSSWPYSLPTGQPEKHQTRRS